MRQVLHEAWEVSGGNADAIRRQELINGRSIFGTRRAEEERGGKTEIKMHAIEEISDLPDVRRRLQRQGSADSDVAKDLRTARKRLA